MPGCAVATLNSGSAAVAGSRPASRKPTTPPTAPTSRAATSQPISAAGRSRRSNSACRRVNFCPGTVSAWARPARPRPADRGGPLPAGRARDRPARPGRAAGSAPAAGLEPGCARRRPAERVGEHLRDHRRGGHAGRSTVARSGANGPATPPGRPKVSASRGSTGGRHSGRGASRGRDRRSRCRCPAEGWSWVLRRAADGPGSAVPGAEVPLVRAAGRRGCPAAAAGYATDRSGRGATAGPVQPRSARRRADPLRRRRADHHRRRCARRGGERDSGVAGRSEPAAVASAVTAIPASRNPAPIRNRRCGGRCADPRCLGIRCRSRSSGHPGARAAPIGIERSWSNRRARHPRGACALRRHSRADVCSATSAAQRGTTLQVGSGPLVGDQTQLAVGEGDDGVQREVVLEQRRHPTASASCPPVGSPRPGSARSRSDIPGPPALQSDAAAPAARGGSGIGPCRA